ncbi:MAG: YjjG family noncanonical pyrimidine nucleotidase [Sediminibacterium sp.]
MNTSKYYFKKSSMGYNFIFFDLDDTLWDCSKNSKETIEEIIIHFEISHAINHEINRFYSLYNDALPTLLELFQKGQIDQIDLRIKRMNFALKEFGISDLILAEKMSNAFIEKLPQKQGIVHGAVEILDYLSNKNYQLNIISNGFHELQMQKLKSAHLHQYFQNVITSGNTGFSKPEKEIFQYALKITRADISKSLMIGDNFYADIEGAKNIGIDQVYLDTYDNSNLNNSSSTYTINKLSDLMFIL